MYKFIVLLSISSIALSADRLSFEQNLNLSTDRLSVIEVINGAGDIDITTNDGNEISVHATITSDKYRSMERLKEVFERDVVFKMDRETEFAVLRAHNKPELRKSPDIQIHLDIQIPTSMDVKIDDGSGSITVSGLAGTLDIEDGSGHIDINRLSNSLSIDDGSGDISASQIKGSIKIEDGSGAITITNSNSEVNIDDGSGLITFNEVNGDKTLNDGSGDIQVGESQGDVHINDGSGDIRIINNQGDATLSDGSGSIYIDALDGALDIKNAGSGKVIIDGENRSKEF